MLEHRVGILDHVAGANAGALDNPGIAGIHHGGKERITDDTLGDIHSCGQQFGSRGHRFSSSATSDLKYLVQSPVALEPTIRTLLAEPLTPARASARHG